MPQRFDVPSDELRARILRHFRYAQVGNCVNGLAHDLNNVLGVILAYAELIQAEGRLPGEGGRMMGELIDGVRKCSDMVGNLTTIARKREADPAMIDPSQLLRHVVELRRFDLRVAGVTLETDIPPSMDMLVVDRAMLKLALIAVLSNVEEALIGALDRRARLRAHSVESGIEVEMWNAGPPIPKEEREAVFEPFYTTKSSPHLGLGLTVARAVAQCHDGSLTYDPERGFVLRVLTQNHLLR